MSFHSDLIYSGAIDMTIQRRIEKNHGGKLYRTPYTIINMVIIGKDVVVTPVFSESNFVHYYNSQGRIKEPIVPCERNSKTKIIYSLTKPIDSLAINNIIIILYYYTKSGFFFSEQS